MSGFKTKLIVAAIDFGTTYSGYAYSLKADFEVNPLKIFTYSDWMDGSGLRTAKTPTVVLFDRNGHFDSFGYEAETKYSQLSADENHKGWRYFRRFKMALHDKRIRREMYLTDDQNNSMLAVKVFAECIKYLKDQLIQRIHKRVAEILETDIHWVLTVPAIWDDAAKQFMKEAADMAGIPEDQLDFALEPEAAAIYCKEIAVSVANDQDRQKELRSFDKGAQFMVMDLGGGTIDITIHEVQKDGSLRELCAPSGGPWGGTVVDENIFQLLKQVFREDVIETFENECKTEMLDLQRDVELKKRMFKPSVTKQKKENVQLAVPSVLFKTFEDERKEKFDLFVARSSFANTVTEKRGKLQIAYDTFLKVFDDSVRETTNHVKGLLHKPELRNVKTVMMVGGFAECDVIQAAMLKALSDKTVKIPEQAGIAVLNGAVIYGFKKDAISSRVLRFSYGVSTSVPFDERHHRESKRCYDRCEDVFKTFLKAGTEVVPRRTTVSHTLNARFQCATIELYRSPSQHPVFVTDHGIQPIGTMKLELLKEPNDGKQLVDISMWMDTSLHVEACESGTNNKVLAKFDFLHDF